MLFSRKSNGNGPEWIVVFLGNPGAKFEGTRHNMGFLTADELCRRNNIRITRVKFKALTELADIGGKRVLLMKPQTYMNLSGDAVQPAASFYKVPPERVLVISDDVSLPAGKIRIRKKGSAGGHNGLKSIIEHLGTEEFPRIKIGVGSPEHSGEMVEWVIGVPKNKDAELIGDAIKRAAEAIEEIIAAGTDNAMNKYNG